MYIFCICHSGSFPINYLYFKRPIASVNFCYHLAAGCKKNWPFSPRLWIRQEGNEAIARCNSTGEQWKLTCVESQHQWVGTLGDCPTGNLIMILS